MAHTDEPLHCQILRGISPNGEFDGDDPWWVIASTLAVRRMSDPAPTPRGSAEPARRRAAPQPAATDGEFVPLAPSSFDEIGLTASEIESLVLKFLLNRGVVSGRSV